jgi:hypothetical protein
MYFILQVIYFNVRAHSLLIAGFVTSRSNTVPYACPLPFSHICAAIFMTSMLKDLPPVYHVFPRHHTPQQKPNHDLTVARPGDVDANRVGVFSIDSTFFLMSIRCVGARMPCSVVLVVSQNARFVFVLSDHLFTGISFQILNRFFQANLRQLMVPSHPTSPQPHMICNQPDLRGIAHASLLTQLGVYEDAE